MECQDYAKFHLSTFACDAKLASRWSRFTQGTNAYFYTLSSVFRGAAIDPSSAQSAIAGNHTEHAENVGSKPLLLSEQTSVSTYLHGEQR